MSQPLVLELGRQNAPKFYNHVIPSTAPFCSLQGITPPREKEKVDVSTGVGVGVPGGGREGVLRIMK